MDTTHCSVSLTGYCGADPIIRYTSSGATLCKLSVATHEFRRHGDDYVRHTQWHNLVCWDQLAHQAASTLKRGDLAEFSGDLKYRTWTDEQGEQWGCVEIRVTSFRLFSPRQFGSRHPLQTTATDSRDHG